MSDKKEQKIDAMAVIKSSIDAGVQKGIYGSADEVVMVTNCYNAVAQRLQHLEGIEVEYNKIKDAATKAVTRRK